MTGGIRERVVRFGPDQSLVGILTMPKGPVADRPYVVIVNAGIIHRVGPNRLYVDMARAVGALGFPVLRFDLAGLGDSGSAQGSGDSMAESALTDVHAAFAHLTATRNVTRFLVFGLCSGANYAAMTAFREQQVEGLLLIDPTVVRTRRSTMVHVVRRLRNLSTLRALVTLRHPIFHRRLGRPSSAAVSVAQAAEGQSGQQGSLDSPSMSETAARDALTALVDRGVQLMLVFTGGVNHVYNYHGQLFDLLPGLDFRSQLRLLYMPDTDHTVSDKRGRTRLLSAVCEWLEEAFPVQHEASHDARESGRTSVAPAGERA
jgi:pimeloyl-ACP methyl ester carboxylesterase